MSNPQPQIEQSDEDESLWLEGEYTPELEALRHCHHSFADGDQVRVLDEYRAHVRDYDMGIPARVETFDCQPHLDEHEVFLVWPSGTGLWVDLDNVVPVRSAS